MIYSMSFSLASTSAFRRCRSFSSRSSWTRLALAIWSAPRMCPLNSARSSSGVAPGSGTSFWRTPVTLTMNSLPALWMLRARSSPASFALCSCCSDSALADGSRSTINAPPQPGHCFHAAAHFLHLVIWHLWQLAWCATWHSSHRVWSCWIAVCMSLHHSCSFCQAVPSSWMISSASGRATSSSCQCHNFAKRTECFKCSVAKPAEGTAAAVTEEDPAGSAQDGAMQWSDA